MHDTSQQHTGRGSSQESSRSRLSRQGGHMSWFTYRALRVSSMNARLESHIRTLSLKTQTLTHTRTQMQFLSQSPTHTLTKSSETSSMMTWHSVVFYDNRLASASMHRPPRGRHHHFFRASGSFSHANSADHYEMLFISC